jgi:S1-C subfamily serine protease
MRALAILSMWVLTTVSCAHDKSLERTVVERTYTGDVIINNLHNIGRHDPVYRSVVELVETKKKHSGTGFIIRNINNNSYALTAQHLCERRGVKFIVNAVPDENNSRKEFVAKAVYVSNEEDDVCLVRIYDTGKYFQVVRFSKKAPKTGDAIMTIGAAVGIFPTKTDGYVIGYDLLGEEEPEHPPGPAKRLVTSLSVAPGNSGGPVYNNEFRVVGMLVAMHPRYDHSSICIHIDTLNVHMNKYFNRK